MAGLNIRILLFIMIMALLIGQASAGQWSTNGNVYYQDWNETKMIAESELVPFTDNYPYWAYSGSTDWFFQKWNNKSLGTVDNLVLNKSIFDVVKLYPDRISFEILTTKGQVVAKSVANGTGQRRILIPKSTVNLRFLLNDKLPDVLIDNGTLQWYANESTYYYSKISGQTWFNFLTAPYVFLNASDNISFIFNSYVVNGSTSPQFVNSTLVNLTINQGTNNLELRQQVDDYISYWRGDNTAKDDNTTSNNIGTLNGGMGYNSSGKYGSAYYFDGINDYVSISDPVSGSLDMGTGNFTTEAWIYITSLTNQNVVMSKDIAGQPRWYSSLILGDGTIRSYVSDNTNYYYVTTTSSLSVNTWYHLVSVFDRISGIKTYVNGNLWAVNEVGTMSSVGNLNNPTVFYLGWDARLYDLGAPYTSEFKGLIDDVRIYKRTLTNTEINLTANQSKYSSGYIKSWYNSNPNETYQIDVNGTNQTNSNISLQYVQNGSSPSGFFGNQNTSLNASWLLNPRYTNTDAYMWLFGNATSSPSVSNITFYDQAVGAEEGEFMPPTPISLSNTTGNFWVNYTWQPGTPGNVTDSYNVSITNNSIQSWSNQTVAFLNSTLASHQWSNISVWAFNSSGTGTLNQTPTSMNTQVQNNNPVISFIDPTLANGSTNTTGSIHINTSVSDLDSDNMTALLNWNNSLVGWWRMNENAGGTLVQDFSGYGNNGTWNGNTTSNVTLGQFGNALQFDGVDDCVDAGNAASLRTTMSFSVSAWLKPTNGQPATKAIYSKIGGGGDRSYVVYLQNDGTLNIYLFQDGTNTAAARKTAFAFDSGQATKYTHSVMVYNSAVLTLDMYIDGVLSNGDLTGTVPASIYDSTTPFVIANEGVNPAFYNGRIDEVRIYNRALSAEEINASYNASAYRLQTNITNLADGEYNYTAYVQDSSGVVNQTETRYVTVNAAGAEEGEFMPPTPINLAQINGSFWVNHTWQAGSGNVTNSYNVSQNSTWTNGSSATFKNVSVSPHGWSNISVYAFNSLGNGTLNQTPVSMNTQVPNNAPVQSAIGNKNVITGPWLNFTVNATDIDSDIITYGTNASKGTLNTNTGNFNWSTTSGDVGTYYWMFNSSDVYGGVDDETITVTVNAEATGTPNITAYYNTINGWNQTAMSVNAGNSVTFNVIVNQTVNNVSWKVEGAEEQNTSSLQFTRVFNTLGTFNVTAQASNTNGTSDIIYTVVTVSATGGGGTNWDYAYGWVNWTNGTMINGASVSTSKGTVNTNAAGYYVFGYVFEHGISYDFNISKNGIWDNKTVSFAVGDYQVVNGTLQAPITNGTPNITSWGNDNTSNATITLSVLKNTNITFNATANQTLTGCTWTGATQINCTANTYAYKNFTSVGIQTVSITGINGNGSTQTITWTITVTGTGGLSLSGYVKNTLEIPLENARIDFNSGYNLTNTSGYYSFSNVSEGTYTTLARAIGYSNATNATTINTDTIINFTMRERMNAQVVPGFEVGILLMAIAGIYWLRKKKVSSS